MTLLVAVIAFSCFFGFRTVFSEVTFLAAIIATISFIFFLWAVWNPVPFLFAVIALSGNTVFIRAISAHVTFFLADKASCASVFLYFAASVAISPRLIVSFVRSFFFGLSPVIVLISQNFFDLSLAPSVISFLSELIVVFLKVSKLR